MPVGEHLNGPKRPAAAAISLIAHRPDDRCTLGPLLACVEALWQRRRFLVAQHGAFYAQYGACGALVAEGVRRGRQPTKRGSAAPEAQRAENLMRDAIRRNQWQSGRHGETDEGCNQRSSEALRGPQRPSEAIRGQRRPVEAIRGQRKEIRGHIRGHRRPSEALRGAIRGHQKPPAAHPPQR